MLGKESTNTSNIFFIKKCYCYYRTDQNYQLRLTGLHLRIEPPHKVAEAANTAWQMLCLAIWDSLNISTPMIHPRVSTPGSPISRYNFQILYTLHWKKYETISKWKGNISELDQVKINGYYINKNILLMDTCIRQGTESWKSSMWDKERSKPNVF